MNPQAKLAKTEKLPGRWAGLMEKAGLEGLTTSLIEAGKPLSPVLAQLLHMADPFLEKGAARQNLRDLAKDLEVKSGSAGQ